MASLWYGSTPPSSNFGFRYSTNVLRAAGAAGAVSTPHTKPPLGELMQEKTIIREKLLNLEAPQPSSYDTAWVAMVPAPGCPQASRFPQCLDWIIQNQRSDGSWGLQGRPGDEPSLLIKDALPSTLACVLALKTWGVGDHHVGKGLHFIGQNMSSVMDMMHHECDKPIGFKVIFPGMLARGIGMGLEMPVTQADVDRILSLRDKELQCMASGSKAFMAFVAEGLGNFLDWNQAVAYQRKNGSFFNSPATTAAAAIHSCNGRAHEYLDSVISLFGNSVPTVYPRNYYTRLRMVDALEKTGISQYFSDEINFILDMTYTAWVANEEEIMLDITACAMAFRLLRMHGYNISADGLAQFSEESSFHDSIQGCLYDTEALLELQKASQVQILEDEMILANIRSWSAKLLKRQLSSNKISRTVGPAEVEHVLKCPFYTTVGGLEHRRNIEHFRTVGIQMLKSAYRVCLPEEILSLAADDFHSCQTVYQEELRHIESWVKEVRLDELEFARHCPLVLFWISASTILPPDLSEARIALCKNCILFAVADDMFDAGGSREEMENFIKLIEMWDAHDQAGFYSEHVEILFRSIYDVNNELGAKATAVQNRSVIKHIAELVASTVRAMMVETNWRITGRLPSFKEYMEAAELSFAIGPTLLSSLYLVGTELPDDVVTGHEYNEMFRHLNVTGRLLNDLQSSEREKNQGKMIDSVRVLAHERSGSMDAAKREVCSLIEASRIELLRLVLNNESAVPWPCRQAFWNMYKVVHRSHVDVDGFAFQEMMHVANDLLLNPLQGKFPPISTN